MTDVLLFQTDDGGEIEIVNGRVTLTPSGIETAAYLSLFGGNENDRGIPADDSLQWWGNADELDAHRKIRSETQALLRALPLTPATARRVEGAASRDLAWMTATGVADAIRPTATMPALNSIHLRVEIDIGDETIVIEHTETR
jgi:phage gp46-like protein